MNKTMSFDGSVVQLLYPALQSPCTLCLCCRVREGWWRLPDPRVRSRTASFTPVLQSPYTVSVWQGKGGVAAVTGPPSEEQDRLLAESLQQEAALNTEGLSE